MIFLQLEVFSQQPQPPESALSEQEIIQKYADKMTATAASPQPNAFMPPAPEQDCLSAIPLCDSAYTQTNAYSGAGNIPNEIDPTASCLLSGEKNDVWYTFTVQAGGVLDFSITPLNVNDDYDWALFNLTGYVCSDIFSNPFLEVRCNYAPNLGCGGVTGANNDTTGTCGGQNEPVVQVLTGETYVINVSNFSTTQFGYTIDFSQSTAVIYDDIPPQPTVTGMNCTDSVFTVSYPTELIDCSTISPDGSDFFVSDLSGNIHPVISAAGAGCSASQPYTSQLIITLNMAAVTFPGFYLLVQNGADGNTFSDKCGNFAGSLGSTDTVAYVNVLNNISLDIGPDTSLCAAYPKPLLNALNPGATYSWTYNQSPVANTQMLQASFPGTYTVTVAYGLGCTSTDSMQLNLLPSFTFSLGNDTSVCQGNPLPVLHTGISNASSYSWYLNQALLAGNTADSLSPTQGGLYVAVVDSGNGSCPGVDTIMVNIAIPPVFNLGNDLVFCEGDSMLVKPTPATAISYQWSFNTTLLGQADSIFVTQQGIYYLDASSAFTCTSRDSVRVTLDRIAGPVNVKCPQNTGSLNVYNWDATPNAIGYLVSNDGVTGWTPPSSGPAGLSHETALSVQVLFVQALSGGSCPPGPVSESKPCDVIIPNILTPNNDGRNDYFFIKNLDQHPGTSLKVFNRWGLNVYESSDYKNNWDGGDATDGIYFYEINVPGNAARTGIVTLLK